MRKSILRFGALALMSAVSISVWAQQTFTYLNNDYQVTNSVAKEVVLVSATADLPANGIAKNGDVEYTITGIGNFAYRAKVTGGITIPETVTEVGASALRKQEIKNSELPQFTSIGEYAFDGAEFTAAGATFAISCDLPKGAFHDATFGAGTTIKLDQMDLVDLNDEVFALESDDNDDGLTFVELPYTCVGKFTTVGTKAFYNRAKLAGFGYKSASSYFLPVALTSVNDYAFAGCSDLKLYFYEQSTYDGIKTVGKYAFSGCKKLDNAMFANICKSFEGLSFAKGSFEDCSLTSVDLSKWTTIDALALDTDNDNKTPDEQFKGIPAFAFSGNPIATLTYPTTNFEAIGESAFEGNRLTTISLPEGLLYVGEKALKSADKTPAAGQDPAVQFTQARLYLPKSLKKIFAEGIGNRAITDIYAWPTLKDNGGTYIPAIEAHTALNAKLTVPVIAPYKTTGASLTTVTSKSLYSDAGWKSDNLGTGFSVQYPQKGNILWAYKGVIYNTANSSTQNEDYGYYTVDVSGFEAGNTGQGEKNNPIIYGFIQAESLQDYYWTEGYVFNTGGKGYKYDVVCKVNFPTAYNNNFIETVTLTPNDGLASLSKDFASFFKDETTFVKYTLPTGAFKDDVRLTSVTFGTGITAIPENAFSGCTELSTVNFDTNAATEGLQSDITSIGKSAFAGTTKLISIDLPSGLTSVGEGAFSDLAATGTQGQSGYVAPRPAGLQSVTLPNTLGTISENAFAAESIEKVYVSYPATAPTGSTTVVAIPVLSKDAFAYAVTTGATPSTDQNHYKADLIVTGDKYLRSNYLTKSYWKKFFKDNISTFVERVKIGDVDVDMTVCADEGGVFKFADDVQAVKVQTQIGTHATGTALAVTVPVSYSRDLAEDLWNPISLPFDVKVSEIDDAEVAELYNVRLNPETGALEAVVWVKLRSTDTMKARTPYVIRPTGKGKGWTLTTKSVIEKTFDTTGYLFSSVDCSTTKERYVITSNFTSFKSIKDKFGYYISESGFSYDDTENGQPLKPYRIYMTRTDRVNNTPLYGKFEDPYNPTASQSTVKVVVLDDEEEAATYINSLNVRDAENLNAPMYDITGRQIVSPVKGQVYIQNGVKKLAK